MNNDIRLFFRKCYQDGNIEAWNKWRKKNPSEEINFSNTSFMAANLKGANLSDTNFYNTNLMAAKFNGANLSNINFFHSDLFGANFSDANLYNGSFIKTFLDGAKFINANLRNANLSEAVLKLTELKGSDLSNATMYYTTFGDIDLSDVKGLKSINHRGPSIIDFGTIVKSNRKIPEKFLRGVGFPEIFIQYLPSLTLRPIDLYSCFISYTHTDKEFAKRLYGKLQGKGVRCWLDDHQITAGDDIHDAIDRGIKLWDKVILCCSKDSLTSCWVNKELEKAVCKEDILWKERQKKTLILLPVDLDGYVYDWDDGKSSIVTSRLIVDFKGWKDHDKFEVSFKKLLGGLIPDDRKSPPPKQKL